METSWNQLIERYLQNELSEEGKVAFEKELAQKPALQEEMELHILVREGAKRAALRKQIQRAGKQYHLRKKLALVTVVVVLIVLAGAVFVALSKHSSNGEITQHTVLNETQVQKMESELAFSGIQPEYFRWNGKDAVFLSKSGVLLSVTKQSFVLNGNPYVGEVLIQWQEAQQATEIVKAGLSTVSGNDLLETQGMFAFQAFTPSGESLQVSEQSGIYVQVPVDEIKQGMMLFQGVKDAKGNIDWQQPRALEKLPVPARMDELDLFPPGYEAKLDEWKWKQAKKQRDSLYLSFEYEPILVEEPIISSTNLDQCVVINNTHKPLQPNYELKSSVFAKEKEIDGKSLFESNCSTCHTAHKNATGPKLYRVRQKWSDGGAQPGSIYRWVWDWTGTAASDKYAEKICEISPVAHLNCLQLKNKRSSIDAIYDYIDGIPAPDNSPSVSNENHIPPSKVLAVWNEKFNHTILATRDFEKRMKAIHATCSEKVFDVYAYQLNRPLWQLDKQVAKMGYGQFELFAAERVGGMAVDLDHLNNLRLFYKSAVARLREIGEKNWKREESMRKRWDNDVLKVRTLEQKRTAKRMSGNFSEEFQFNLENTYRQLGKTIGFKIRGTGKRSSKNGPVIMNIDRYVRTATFNRQTTRITDTVSGKTAIIRYQAFTARISNAERYGKLMLYLFPKEWVTYQRMDGVRGMFSYSLNVGVQYDAAVIGINDQGYFLSERSDVKGGDWGTIDLKAVSEQEFDRRINQLNAARSKQVLSTKEELDWVFKEQQNYVEQKRRRDNAAFRAALLTIVFPCQKIAIDSTEEQIITVK